MFLKSASKRLSRVGTEVVKVLFSLDVKRVIFSSDAADDLEGALLSVCFERGGKLASSKDKTITEPSDSSSPYLAVDETLSLVVTLYKDGKGVYQEKSGKIVLRQFKKSKITMMSGVNGYKGIGAVVLPLHQLVTELLTGSKDYSLPLAGKAGITVQMRMSVRLVGRGVGDDDASVMSGMSDQSDMSNVAATFDADLFPDSGSNSRLATRSNSQTWLPPTVEENEENEEVDDEQDNHTGNGVIDREDQEIKTSPRETDSTAKQYIPSIISKLTNRGTDKQLPSQSLSKSNAPKTSIDTETEADLSNPFSAANDTTTPPSKANSSQTSASYSLTYEHDGNIDRNPTDATQPNDLTSNSPSNAQSRQQSKLESKSSNMPIRRFPLMGSSDDSEDKKPFNSKTIKSKSGAAKKITAEKLELQAECDSLSRQLKSKQKEFEELKRQTADKESEAQAQLLAARTDLHLAQAELKRMQVGRSAVAVANEKADGVLAAALARAREETAAVSEEYAAAAAQLQARDEELVQLRASLAAANKGWEEERAACLEAATVAAAAAFRRAEAETESAEMLDALIDAKMRWAQTAQERDEDKRKVFVLRRRLQQYAERLAALEVSCVNEQNANYYTERVDPDAES